MRTRQKRPILGRLFLQGLLRGSSLVAFDGLTSPIYIGIFDWPTQAGGLPIVGTSEDARASSGGGF